jgi:tRNA(Arg) A34 adenosine deaminase TadA
MEKLALMAEDMQPVAAARIVSCLVHKNEIISHGFNMRRTDPLQRRFSKNVDSIFLHSEIHCIKNAIRRIGEDELKNMKNTRLYVVRVKKRNNHSNELIFGMSRPCIGCSRAIREFNISECYYSLDGDFNDRHEYGVWFPNG